MEVPKSERASSSWPAPLGGPRGAAHPRAGSERIDLVLRAGAQPGAVEQDGPLNDALARLVLERLDVAAPVLISHVFCECLNL